MTKREFKVKELGTSYILDKWAVVDGEGIKKVSEVEIPANESRPAMATITFVRGDKEDNGEIVPRVDGILHETLLAIQIHDLKYKNSLVSSKETSKAIVKLQEALFWLEERSHDRESRSVKDN